MKILFTLALVFGSVSSFADVSAYVIELETCKGPFEQEIFESTSTNKTVLRSTGMRCMSEGKKGVQQQQCQQYQYMPRPSFIHIDTSIRMKAGEVKIYKGMLYRCN